jgi:hypothetical protein
MRRAVAVVLAVLLTLSAARAADKEPATGLEGYWLGKLKVNAALELRLGFNVTKKPDGALTATFDSLDQGAKGIPVDEITFKDSTAKFTIKKLAASFEGKLDKEGQELEGTFTQRDTPFPLILKRQDKPPEV